MKTEVVLLNIQQLIDKASCGIDGFFTDSKTAAKEILTYLQKENLLYHPEIVEMQRVRAA